MSKTYYDHLVVLEKVDVVIRTSTQTLEEREELWHLVDEIVHHRILETVLVHLPSNHHEEFLSMFHEAPYDDSILEYLNSKMEEDIEDVLKSELELLEGEILQELGGK